MILRSRKEVSLEDPVFPYYKVSNTMIHCSSAELICRHADDLIKFINL